MRCHISITKLICVMKNIVDFVSKAMFITDNIFILSLVISCVQCDAVDKIWLTKAEYVSLGHNRTE